MMMMGQHHDMQMCCKTASDGVLGFGGDHRRRLIMLIEELEARTSNASADPLHQRRTGQVPANAQQPFPVSSIFWGVGAGFQARTPTLDASESTSLSGSR